MAILALETSSARGTLALLAGPRLLAEHLLPSGMLHGRGLVAGIARFLSAQAVSPQDLEGILVSAGPGSFTGIRLGVTAAKTLAFALEIPARAASSLEVLAAGLAGEEPAAGRVVPLLDARQGHYFWASFRPSRGAAPAREVEDRVDTAGGIVQRLGELQESGGAERILVAGEGADRFLTEAAGLLEGSPRALALERAPRGLDCPSARVLGTLHARALEGAAFEPASVHALEPRYLRLAEAQRRLAAAAGEVHPP